MAKNKTEIIGMTIEELIDTLDIKVKLGAKRGSAYIFCGQIGDMDIDGLDTDIIEGYKLNLMKTKGTIKANESKPKAYKDYKAEQSRMLGRKLASLERELEEKGEKQRAKIEAEIEELKEEYKPTRKGYNEWLKAILKRITTAKKTKEKIEKRIREYTSIRDRKVIDIYKSIDEEDTYIVIYDGNEVGTAWTTEEFESGDVDYGYED